MGCIVDAVTQVMRINPENIQAAPDIVKAEGATYIVGFARLESRLIILLEIGELLDPAKMDQVREVARRGTTIATSATPNS